MKASSRNSREVLVDAASAAACFLAPLFLLGLFVGSPHWHHDVEVETTDAAAVQYAIQATRLNPYVETF